MFGRGLLKVHFCKYFVKISGSEIAINANFHFSHYKSIEILSCHSSESNDNKNAIFVEADVMNIPAKFQLYPSYGF